MTQQKGKKKLEQPIKGLTEETFVQGYKTNSRMDANLVNGTNLSGHAGRLIESLYRYLDEKN